MVLPERHSDAERKPTHVVDDLDIARVRDAGQLGDEGSGAQWGLRCGIRVLTANAIVTAGSSRSESRFRSDSIVFLLLSGLAGIASPRRSPRLREER